MRGEVTRYDDENVPPCRLLLILVRAFCFVRVADQSDDAGVSWSDC